MDVFDLEPSLEENRELWNNDRPNWDQYTGWTIQHAASGRYIGVRKEWAGEFSLISLPDDSCQWVFVQPTRHHYRPPFPTDIRAYTWRRGGFHGRFYGVCLLATQAIGSGGCLCSWSKEKKAVQHWARVNLVTWADPEDTSKFCVGLAREAVAGASQVGILAVGRQGQVDLSYPRPNDESPLSIEASEASSLRFVPVSFKPQPIVKSPPPPLPPVQPEDQSLVPQKRVPWREEYGLGCGVDFFTLRIKMSAFEEPISSTIDTVGGGTKRTQAFAATTARSKEALKLSGPDLLCSPNAWPYIPVDATFHYSGLSSQQSLSSEETVTFAYVQVHESGQSERMLNGALVGAPHHKLKQSFSTFNKMYGSHYVYKTTLGSCLTIHFVLRRTQQRQNRSRQSLFNFGVQYLTAGFGASWASQLQHDMTRENFKLQIFWKAVGVNKDAKGSGGGLTPEQIPNLIQWFESNREPSPIFATIQTYAQISKTFSNAYFAEPKARGSLLSVWPFKAGKKGETVVAIDGPSDVVKT